MPRKMKASGVEWIGEIPQEWDTHRIKLDYAIYAGATPKSKKKEYWDGDVNWVTPSDFKTEDKFVSRGKRNLSVEGLNACSASLLPVGSIIFSKRAPIGTVAISTENLSTNQGCLGCVPKKNANSTFMYYCMSVAVDEFNMHGQGTTFMEIAAKDFSVIKMPYPPQNEQESIVRYLDSCCVAINRTLTDARQSIKKLEEYKASLITKAVTKGLNPNVKMQDSDVEWMGRIPAHWRTFRMKFLLKEKMKYGANAAGVHFDEKLPRYVRITDIDNETNRLKDEGRLSLPLETATPYLLDDKDILFARSGATVGKSFFYRKEHGQAAYAGYLIRAQVDSRKALPEFVYYYTQSSYYRIWKDYVFTQATIQNINAQKYGDFILAIPSIKEQEAIISYLDAECASVDRLIAQKQQLIEKFTEYKQSLIYAAVTGKIDCREEALK